MIVDQRAACPSAFLDGEAERPWSRGELLQLALQYRAWGWSVVPVRGDKRPAAPWKTFQTRRATDRELGRLFERPDVAGLGIIPGPVSGGLLVLDFDTIPAAKTWAADNPDLAASAPMARTRRGVHVYLRAADRRPRYWKFQGGELLGDGKHYAILPPTPHPAGGMYQWLREPHRLADVPTLSTDELARCLPPPVTPRTTTTVSVSVPSLSPKPTPGIGAPDRQQTADSRKTDPAANRHRANTSCVSHPPLELVEREAVLRHVPDGPGERNAKLWSLARELKALPHLADARPADLEPHVRFWHELAVGIISTKAFAASMADFRRQWAAVKVPAGVGLSLAVERSRSGPPPVEAGRFTDPADRALVALAVELQRSAGPTGVFFLSARAAAKACDFGSHITAWRRLNELVGDGLLERTHRGIPGATSRTAASFRWLGAAGSATG